MKIQKIILGHNLNLVGFVVKGTDQEFGRIGTGETIERLTVPKLCDLSPRGNGVYQDNNFKIYRTKTGGIRIQELHRSRVRLRDLGCCYLNDNGSIVEDVRNTIELLASAYSKGVRVGYLCKLFGTANKYLADKEIVRVSNYLVPVNFNIRNINDRAVFAGKANYSINNLPRIDVDAPGANTSTPSTSAGKQKAVNKPEPAKFTRKVEDRASIGVDILDLIKFAQRRGGYFINFSDNEYNTTGEVKTTVSDEFKDSGIGEIASAYLVYNKTKFNASLTFKRPGYVMATNPETGEIIDSNGIACSIARTKNVFYGGRYHMPKIGIVVHQNFVQELMDRFSGSLSVVAVNDIKIVNEATLVVSFEHPELRLKELSEYKVFRIEMHNLDFISSKKFSKCILSNNDVRNLVYELTMSELESKVIRNRLDELKKRKILPRDTRPIIRTLQDMSPEQLKMIDTNGIDIKTGLYRKTKPVKSEGDKKAANEPEVAYMIDGLNVKSLTVDKLNNPSTAPARVSQLCEQINGMDDGQEKADMLASMLSEHKKNESAINEALWKHKTCMYLKSGLKCVHEGQEDSWEIDTKSRTKARRYKCKDNGAEDLCLLVANIDIYKA